MGITDYAKGKVEGLRAAYDYALEFRMTTEKVAKLLTPSVDACVPLACQIKILVEVENDLYGMLIDAESDQPVDEKEGE